MSVHISCPGCHITLSFGQTECPVCETTFPCREEDIIYDSEGYKEKKENVKPFEEQIRDMESSNKEFDKDAM